MKFFYKLIILNVFLALSASNASAAVYTASSALSGGKWVKMRVPATGIYKLTYEDLTGMGFSNPANVQLYGYGGWMLDENFGTYKIDDLPQMSVWVEKGSDGVFNAGDYILFYARGPLKWEYNASSKEFVHTNNPYSNYGYYFVTESNEPTKQMNKVQSLTSYTKEFTGFNDYQVYEKDLVSIGRVGREFYGEDFSVNTDQNFSISTPGVISENAGKITVNFIAKTATATPVTVQINGTNTLTKNVPKYEDGETDLARETSVTGTWSGAKSETNIVNVAYGAVGHTNARLNYIRLNYDRALKFYQDPYVLFRQVSAMGSNSKYNIGGSNQNVKIWDISDVENICQIDNTVLTGNVTSFITNALTLQEFVAVDVSQKNRFAVPEIIGPVENQNLHALGQTDMVIITHPDFITQAERLADFHRTVDKMRVHVVSAEQIYNEFSSGTPDASAYRRFMKMFYDRGKSSGDSNELPKYLLLFGDGCFDNRGILSDWSLFGKCDYLLTFQSVNSISTTSTYCTDDYFGFLEDTSGNIQANRVDIGIGRFPVKTLQEAVNVVDKTINYVADPILSPWKNNVCLIACDGDNKLHETQADSIARYYFQNGNKNFILNKIYLETYKKDLSSSGCLFPDAKKKFFDLLQSGTLLVNYTGHSSESNLAISSTRFFSKQEAVNLTNDKLPLFIAASCSYSHFDDYNNSSGEELLLNAKGGAIAVYAATRVVNSTPNFKINMAFADNMFKKNENGHNLALGDISKLSKRQLVNDLNKLNFILLGDPALRLPYPEYKAQVTTINGMDVTQQTVKLSAGSTVTIAGRIVSPSGSIASDFSGTAVIDVFDSKKLIDRIMKAGTGSKAGIVDTTNVYDQAEKIFSGKTMVVNGQFSMTFIVPKAIAYTNEKGKINIYAVSQTQNNEAQGYFDDFLIGGTSNTAAFNDVTPPQINSLYIGSPNFQSGNKVNDQSVFVVEVEDKETGINTFGGAGRDAFLSIDNSSYTSYVLNSYFENEPGNPKKGKFTFTLPSLTEGKHTLQFRVWDIMDNSTVSQPVEFEIKPIPVIKDFDLNAISDNESVTFFIENNTNNSDVNFNIEVYNLAGDLVWNSEQNVNTDILKTLLVKWNKTGNDSKNVNPGIYTYKAVVFSGEDIRSTDVKKIVIQ